MCVRCNSAYHFHSLLYSSCEISLAVSSLGFYQGCDSTSDTEGSLQKLLPAGTPGEKTGEVVDTDLTGGFLCGACMVGSQSPRRERCRVFLSMRCTLFPEKHNLQLKRNGNTSGRGISADMKINLF